MLKKFVFFILFCVMLSGASYSDDLANVPSIDAETNASAVENSIKINEEEFDRIVQQVKRRYTDFDWAKFDGLDAGAKRVVIKNYLARIAFDSIKENYIRNFYAKATDGVEIQESGYNTIYFNKSDAKYRTEYITGKGLIEKAGRRCRTCDDEGNFRQQDVALFDELIAQEIANAPVAMHCEKYCMESTSESNEMARELRNAFAEFQQANEEYTAEIRRTGSSRQEIREARKRLREAERAYKKLVKRAGRETGKMWFVRPYNTTCDLVSVECWNVELRPEMYEKVMFSIDKTDDTIDSLHFEYDNLTNNTHTESDAYRNCNCEQTSVDALVNCNCLISFYDEIQDLSAVRKWENQERIDIKNGINQDRDANGHWNHDWESNTVPGGRVVGRQLDLSGTSTR